MKLQPGTSAVAVDIETVSACDIKAGAARYSEDESTRVWCVVFGAVPELKRPRGAKGVQFQCLPRWVRWSPGDTLPAWLVDWILSGGPLWAHNHSFERSIWDNILAPRYGWHPVPVKQWRDTQWLSMYHNLPPTLDGATKAAGCAAKKDADGAKLMRKLAKAKATATGYEYPQPTPDELRRLTDYCRHDVAATIDLMRRLPPPTATEWVAIQHDAQINARGVSVDLEFAEKMRRVADLRAARLNDEAFALTGGGLFSLSSNPALKAWVKAQGATLPKVPRKRDNGKVEWTETCDKGAQAELLADPSTPKIVRDVLALRAESGKATSLAKLAAAVRMVCRDGRLRDMLWLYGAHTGRWTSSGFQLHNLPKDKLGHAWAEVLRGYVQAGDLEALEWCEGNVLGALSQLLRSLIVAKEGCDLIAADFSSIEARGAAWLAGQQDKLDFLFNFDREMARYRAGERADKPEDLYEFNARKIGSDDRQLGKVSELALTYGMGDVKFVDTAHGWGVPIANKLARSTKKLWREGNAAIVQFWHDAEDTCRELIVTARATGRDQEATVGRLTVTVDGKCRAMKVWLPSGRPLTYWRPSVKLTTRTIDVMDDDGVVGKDEMTTEEIRFWTVDKNKTDMRLEGTYGGKLVENWTQATCRELLSEAVSHVDGLDPYRVVLHVHDSIVTEVPAGTGDVAEFERLIARVPAWAEGFPIAADGYRSSYFRG